MYFRLQLNHVPSSKEDWVSQFCFDHGCSGISETLDFRQTSDHYQPETLSKDKINLDVYFESKPSEDFLILLQNELPQVRTTFIEEEIKDWLAEWKKGFESFPLVDTVWVVPSWKQPPVEADRVLHIDPGMAFGTGTHATTQLASQFLYELLKKNPQNHLIDVGTGSGLLSFLASQLGVQNIQATEIDEMACMVAKENAKRNSCSHIEFIQTGSLTQFTKAYDVVVANIIDGVLLDLKEDLKRLTRPLGYLVLTGILEERDQAFRQKFDFNSFEVLQRSQKEEWIGYLLKKKAE